MSDALPDTTRFAHRLQGRASLTAEAVCLARALEHLKPEDRRVVDDPYAELFLSGATRLGLRAWSGSFTGRVFRRLAPSSTSYVPLRHRFIDDGLTAALDAGAEQVVLLGAGYDTRAYRFAETLAGRPVYEVDLPTISRSKAAIIAEHAGTFPETNMVRVEIDFESQALDDVLPDAGFTKGARTFVTWEGVPMYLTRAAVKATLEALWRLCGGGSVLAFDMWHLVDDPSPMGTASRTAPTALSFIGEPVTFGIHPEEIDSFLRLRGFTVADLALAPDLRQRYAPDDTVLIDGSLYVLTAERLDAPVTH